MQRARWVWLLGVMALLLANMAFARAGGGGGTGGAGIWGIILWPIVMIYVGVVGYLVARRSREARLILKKASRTDRVWLTNAIKERVHQVFFKVQEAWTERNQDIAKAYMSDALYLRHKLQTDAMLRNGTRNALEAINLSSVQIVSVDDFSDDSKDQFWAYLEGSMLDYTVREASGAVIKGDKSKPESFVELWLFIRQGDTWVLDRIDPHVLTRLLTVRSSKESKRLIKTNA